MMFSSYASSSLGNFSKFCYSQVNLSLHYMHFKPIPACKAKDTVPLWSLVRMSRCREAQGCARAASEAERLNDGFSSTRQIAAGLGVQIWRDFMVTWLKNRVERLFNTRGFHGKGPLFSLYSPE